MADFPNALDALLGLPVVQAEGVDLARRNRINFTGDLVVAVVNGEVIDVTIADPGTSAWKAPVRVAHDTNFDGTLVTLEAGSTLTANANGALAAVDGETLIVGDSVLLISQTDEKQNGIYLVEDLGSASTPAVFRRRGDAKATAQFQNGVSTRATEGSTYAGRVFVATLTAPFAIDTQAQVWSSSAVSGAITAPADPADDGKIARADGGDLVYIGAAAAGSVLRWNGSEWVGQAIDPEDANSFTGGAVRQVLTSDGSAGLWSDDLTLNGQLGWGGGEDTAGQGGLVSGQSTDGSAAADVLFTAPADWAGVVVVVVIAKEDATGDCKIWELKRKFNSVGGTLAAVSDSIELSADYTGSASAWVASLQFDGQDVRVERTGEAAKTIDWRHIVQRIYYLG